MLLEICSPLDPEDCWLDWFPHDEAQPCGPESFAVAMTGQIVLPGRSEQAHFILEGNGIRKGSDQVHRRT